MISSTSPLPDDAVWLVTGCSSGIGAALCKFVSEHGHRLVATARKLETLTYLPDSPKLLKLALDVTSEASVEAALEKTLATFGRIDVLVNNAGYGMLGVTEAADEKDLRALMETNFWGTLRLTRAAVKIFRDEDPRSGGSIGGVVVQVSSMGGRVAFPGDSIYHASKWAVEGFSESMAKEMHPDWKIKFLILEPGGTKSQFSSSSMVKGPSHPAYTDPAMAVNQILKYFDDPKNLENWADPVRVAKAIFETVGREDMPLRLATGRDAWQAIWASDEERAKEMDKWKEVSISCSEPA